MSGFRNAPSITEFAVGMRVKLGNDTEWMRIVYIGADGAMTEHGTTYSLTFPFDLDLDSIWVGRKYTESRVPPLDKQPVSVIAICPNGDILYRQKSWNFRASPGEFLNYYTPVPPPSPAPEPPVKTLEEILKEWHTKVNIGPCPWNDYHGWVKMMAAHLRAAGVTITKLVPDEKGGT